MPTNLKDLAAGLHSFFAEKVPGGVGDAPGDMLLVFDALGVPLDPLEFGAGAGVNSGPLDVFANQRAAELADQLPAANVLASGSYLPRSGSRLSRWYEAAIEASTSIATQDPELAAFEQRKATALELFEENKIIDVAMPGVGAAVVGEHDHHYATSMSPRGWFMPDSQSWSPYTQSGGGAQPHPDVVQPIPIPDFELRVVEPDPPPEVARYIGNADELAIRNIADVDAPHALPIEEFKRLAAGPRVGNAITIRAGGIDVGQAAIRAAAIDRPFEVEPARAGIRTVDQPSAAGRLTAMLTAGDLERVVAASTTQPVQTEGFSVSFDYTIVTFERAWWDDVFLAVPGWRMPGFTAGQIATGKASQTASQFITMMTCGMVVIRSLKITAAWQGADLAAAPSATSLGPFCIAGAEWNEQELRRPGLQVIAWVCQVPPVLPPN